MTTPDRPLLGDIRRRYQVADDAAIDYRPRLAGAVDIPFTTPRRITQTEGRMLDHLTFNHGLAGLASFAGLAERAGNEALTRYPDSPSPPWVPAHKVEAWQGNDGHRDAFRHAYWNALMTQQHGRGWTSVFATAHEALPGNPANREAMDLYNNAVGRSIAAAHPNATQDQLADLISGAVRDGTLIVMDRSGQLAWSDHVALGMHGISPTATIEPHLPVPQRNTTSGALHGDDAPDTALAAMAGHPLYLQAAAALDERGMNPLNAHVVYRSAALAGLANVQRIEPGQPVTDADGNPTRHLFAFGDRQPGVAGRDYALITQADLVAITPRVAAETPVISPQHDMRTAGLMPEQSAPRPLSMGA